MKFKGSTIDRMGVYFLIGSVLFIIVAMIINKG
jgi:hypothetical protein